MTSPEKSSEKTSLHSAINSSATATHIQHDVVIPDTYANKRLDQVLASLFPEYSRSRLKEWIEKGYVKISGKELRPKDKVKGGEAVSISAEIEAEVLWEPENLPLNIIFEDEDILIIHKPKGVVVHPGSGNQRKTLVNALLYHVPELKNLPRAGIVHRLDKDTSGLLVVAKTELAYRSLIAALKTRSLKREYEAIVFGEMPSGGTVSAPIARHPHDRKRMAVVDWGKPAITHYRVLKRYKSLSHIFISLETGRTHQIRVHMNHIGYPIVGDKTYGGRLRVPRGSSEVLLTLLREFPRQALHAKNLGLKHPKTGEELYFTSELPEDMKALINELINS